jgi:hypothetical protein
MSNPRAKDQHAEAVKSVFNITWAEFVTIHREITRICASRDAIFRSLCVDQVLAVASRPSGSESSFDAAVDAVCARSLKTSQEMVNDGSLDTNGTYTAQGVNFWAMEFEEAKTRDQSSNARSKHMKRGYAESSDDARPALKRTKHEEPGKRGSQEHSSDDTSPTLNRTIPEESKKRGYQEHSSDDGAPISKRSRFAESLKRSRDEASSDDATRDFKRTKTHRPNI